jgi:hypothetical protein
VEFAELDYRGSDGNSFVRRLGSDRRFRSQEKRSPGAICMDKFINVGLLKHPMNWIIVSLMVILAGIGMEIVFKQFSSERS